MNKTNLILGAALLGAACLPALAQQKPDAAATAVAASAPGTGPRCATSTRSRSATWSSRATWKR